MDKERLGKIVMLAKNGLGGERDNAVRLVKKICAENNLDFDAVMSDDEVEKEFTISYKTRMEQEVIVQIIIRYGVTSIHSKVWENVKAKIVGFKTTQEKYIETLNAISVLLPLFRKEYEKMSKAIFYGFLEKHSLFYKPRLDEMEEYVKAVEASRKETSEEEREKARIGRSLSGEMQDAHIHKQLGNGGE